MRCALQIPLHPATLRQLTAFYAAQGQDEYNYVREHGFRGCDPAS